MTHTSRNLRSLRDSKIKDCIIPRNEIIGGKPLWCVKNIVLPKSSRPHNPKIGKQSSPFQIILNEALNIAFADVKACVKQMQIKYCCQYLIKFCKKYFQHLKYNEKRAWTFHLILVAVPVSFRFLVKNRV